jgi:Protein of unknown function (DUF3309)
MGLILLILVILLLCGGLPTNGYGYGPGIPGLLFLVLVVIIVLALLGHVQVW